MPANQQGPSARPHATCEQHEADPHASQERVRWLEAAHLLLANEYAFTGPAGGAIFYASAGWRDGTPILALNMNDVFAWGCADAESFEYIDAPALVELVKRDGHAGLVKWARDRRAQKNEGWDEQHLRKYTPELTALEQRDKLADALSELVLALDWYRKGESAFPDFRVDDARAALRAAGRLP